MKNADTFSKEIILSERTHLSSRVTRKLHFGLGANEKADSIEILCPSGEVTRLGNIASDQVLCVKEGVGIVKREFPRVR